MRRNIVMTIVVILSLFVGSLIMYFFAIYFGLGKTVVINKTEITETSINKSIEKVFDSTVTIETYKNSSMLATGSGFVYKKTDTLGYILTNYHVIKGATSVQVIMSDDTIVNATVLGTDEKADVAVLSISKDYVIQVATLGNPDKLKIGDILFTIGSPSGSGYRGTVTKGIVSAMSRYLSMTDSSNDNYVIKVIQTDAPINPGNSGGALVNVNGQVIGITSLKLGTDEKIEGIGFAIPISDILKYTDRLENSQKIVRPTIDLSYVSLTDTKTINSLGLTSDGQIDVGVMVTLSNITEIAKGNIIIAINDTEIESAEHFSYLLSLYKPTDKVKIRYYNGKEIKTIEVSLK